MRTHWKHGLWVALLLALAAACAPAPLAVPPPAPVVDNLHDAVAQQVEADLTAREPAAVPVFQAASEAFYLRDDWQAAEVGYKQVLEMVPDYGPALRQLSYVAHRANDDAACVTYAERALAAEPSGLNHTTLAWAYLYLDTDQGDLDAFNEVQQALVTLADDPDTIQALFYAANGTGHIAEAEEASAKFLALAPWNPAAHYLAGIVAAYQGRAELGEMELHLAEQMGMRSAVVEKALREANITSEARDRRWERRGGYLVGGWLLGYIVVFAVGGLFSYGTLARVRRWLPGGDPPSAAGPPRLPTLYQTTIAAASIYFYASIFYGLALLLALMAGVAYRYQVGDLSNYQAAAAELLLLAVVGMSLRAWRTWLKRPATSLRPLTRPEAPALWAMVEDVARRLGTRPVTVILVGPYAQLAIFERGTLVHSVLDRSERCLSVGLGLLPGLTQGQLRALLAHEYSFVAGRDLPGGRLTVRMRAALGTLVSRLSSNGQARRWNPAWLFANAYWRAFQGMTQGAARLQLILADRAAALTYGASEFANGLRHAVRQYITFDQQAQIEMKRTRDASRPALNIYTQAATLHWADQRELETRISRAMTKSPGPHDSHPPMSERLRLVEGLPPVITLSSEDRRPAWDLLRDPERLQAEMLIALDKLVNARPAKSKAP